MDDLVGSVLTLLVCLRLDEHGSAISVEDEIDIKVLR